MSRNPKDEFAEGVPSVTGLLNPGLTRARDEFSSVRENTRTMTRAYEPEPHSLTDLGVRYELVFQEDFGMLRLARIKPHIGPALQEWQHAFFSKMKLDMRSLEVSVTFQEFAANQYPFHQEVFSLNDGEFVQIIRSRENKAKVYVLISTRSLLQRKEKVYQFLEGAASEQNDDSDSIKIEIA